MTEELQGLLERIQKEGVAKAEAEAERIQQEAHAKARQAVADAERRAEDIRAHARKDAEALVEHGTQSIRQAARDVLLSVEQSLRETLRRIVLGDVRSALTPERTAELVARVVEAYVGRGKDPSDLAVLLPEAQRKDIEQAFLADVREKLAGGIEIASEGGIVSGFRVSEKDGRIEHDFTAEAIAETICAMLRPRLAEIVASARNESAAADEKPAGPTER